jgi:hypothetical protein
VGQLSQQEGLLLEPREHLSASQLEQELADWPQKQHWFLRVELEHLALSQQLR